MGEYQRVERGSGVEYAASPDRCRERLAQALRWPVASVTKNAEVRLGRFDGSPVISLMWSQSFPLRYLARLREFLGADKLGFYAAKWDQTYVTSEVLWDGSRESVWAEAADLSTEEAQRQRAWLVRYEFSGGFPLCQRDLLYLIIEKEYRKEYRAATKAKETELAELVYSYPSVSQSYAVRGLGVPPAALARRAPVRSRNLDPSVDRIRVEGDKVVLDHLMTTELCGWVPNCAYNHVLRSALIGAYAHEAEALRACVMSD